LGSVNAQLRGAGGPGGSAVCQPDGWTDTSPTTWHLYRSLCYDSGKCLPSLVTWHNTSDNSAREVDVYTKPYGRTRWEAWSCEAANCSMMDHRDWSFYRGPIPDGGWYPAYQWPTYYAQAKGNWLADGDFATDIGRSWSRWNDANGNNPSWSWRQEWPSGV